MDVGEEVSRLKEEITRLGEKRPDGSIVVKFGKLFDETADIFEALVGTLRAAKRRKLIMYGPEVLFQGRDNDEDVILLPS